MYIYINYYCQTLPISGCSLWLHVLFWWALSRTKASCAQPQMCTLSLSCIILHSCDNIQCAYIYTCILIKYYVTNVHVHCRWNMALDEKVYTESHARSLTQMKKTKWSDSGHVHLGCIHPPLELENIVLDELHLLLRIGDVLIQNLILFADSRDHRSKAHRGVVTSHIKELEAAIQSCGVSFQIQQKREANGKPIPGSYEWTALTRKHKRLVLKRLPEKISTLLPSQLCQAVTQLWKIGLVS